MTKKTNFKKHLLASASVLAIGAFAAAGAGATTVTLDSTASNFGTATTDVNNVGSAGAVVLSSSKTMTDTAGVTLNGTSNFTFSDSASSTITLTGNTGPGIVTAGATAGTVTIGAGDVVTADSGVDAMGVITGNTLTALVNAGSLIGVAAGDGLQVAGSGVITTITNTGTLNSTQTGAGINLTGTGVFTTITNTAGLISATTTGSGIALASTASITTLTNTGTIRNTTGTGSGILMAGTGTIATLNNTGGTIEGGSASGAGFGINLTGASTITALTNTGTIRATTGGGAGIKVVSTANITTLTNTGLINDGAAGIGLSYLGTSAGTINNNAGGTISATGAGTGVNFAGAYTGSLINAGTISAGTTGKGVNVANGASLTTLTNSGSIFVGSTGSALALAGTGAITNFTNSGTLSAVASTAGVVSLAGTGSIGTTFTNSGTIKDTGDGIALGVSGVLGSATTLTNTGTITSAASTATNGAVVVSAASTNFGITNSGSIAATGTSGKAIQTSGTGARFGTISNSGTISATSGTAIDLSSVTTAVAVGTITNTGLITGSIVLSGASASSTLNMNATNTFTSSTSTISGNQVTGDITTAGTDAIVFNPGTSTTQWYGGAITGATGVVTVTSGTNTLTKSGTGKFVVNTLSVASGATLYLAGQSAGTVTTTTGSTAGTTTLNGTLQLGSKNTLTSGGTFTQNSGGVVTFDVTNTSGTLSTGVLAMGTQTLALGNASGIAVNYSSSGTGYTSSGVITPVTSTGTTTWVGSSGSAFASLATVNSSTLATSGTGNTLSDNSYTLAFTAYRDSVTTTNIDILVTRANTYQSSTTNVNESAVGTALESIANTGDSALDTIHGTLDGLSSAAAVAADLKTLTATNVESGSTTAALVQTSSAAIGTVEHRMETARNETSGVATGGKANNNGVWGEVFGSAIDQGTRNNVDGYQATVGGFSVGADTLVNSQTRVGAAFAYAKTGAEGTSNNTDVDTYQGSIYGTYDMGKVYYEGIGSFAYNDYSTSRTLFDSSVASASFSGQQYDAKATAGYKVDVQGGLKVTPFVSAEYAFLTQDNYTETGSNANLSVKTDDINIFKTGLGTKLAYPITDAGITYTPRLSGAWYYDFIGDEASTTSNFSSATTTFITKGAGVARNSFRLGAGLDVLAQDNVTVSLDYNWDAKQDFNAHTGELKARFEF